MKLLIASAISIVMFFIMSQSASAHVLITDTSGTKGAIFHINPDDDPIAGQESTLYFDMQNRSYESSGVAVRVTIKQEGTDSIEIPMELDGTLATTKYTFPEQDVYELTFTVKAEGETTLFTQDQRVSRGTAGSVLDKPSHSWAEASLTASIAGMLVLSVVTFNRRRDIAKYSVLKK